MDSLRLDAVHAIFDRSAVHFLEQLAFEVKTLETERERPLVLIAEIDLNDPRIVRPPEEGGYGLDAQWNEDFHHSLFALLTGDHAGVLLRFWPNGPLCPLSHVRLRLRRAAIRPSAADGTEGPRRPCRERNSSPASRTTIRWATVHRESARAGFLPPVSS